MVFVFWTRFVLRQHKANECLRKYMRFIPSSPESRLRLRGIESLLSDEVSPSSVLVRPGLIYLTSFSVVFFFAIGIDVHSAFCVTSNLLSILHMRDFLALVTLSSHFSSPQSAWFWSECRGQDKTFLIDALRASFQNIQCSPRIGTNTV